jgi:hypothetical protein
MHAGESSSFRQQDARWFDAELESDLRAVDASAPAWGA